MSLFALGLGQQQDLLSALHQVVLLVVLFLETVDQYDVTSLLGGLASVEVEVDEGGEQARGGQQQQHLQQTILHLSEINCLHVPSVSSGWELFRVVPRK